GPAGEDDLTLGALKALKQGNLILRTEDHGVVPFLQDEGISYTTLDDLYEKSDTFEDAYSAMIGRIVDKAQTDDVVLGVPGHPMIGERLVVELLSRLDGNDFTIEIVAGLSRADAVMAEVVENSNPNGIKFIMASELKLSYIDTNIPTIISEID